MNNVKKTYTSTFLIPALVVYTLLFIIPVLMGFGYSLTNWNSMGTTIKFVGLKHYIAIFQAGGEYMLAIKNTLVFASFSSLFKVLAGLLLALFLNMNFRSKELLRGIYFIPFAISPLIIGIIFTSVFEPAKGFLNMFLRSIGLGIFANQWLVDRYLALPSTIFVEVWRGIGLNMVVFLAGLQAIDKTYYEAAKVDGANSWKLFLHITMPFLVPAVMINVVLNIIHGLKVFDIIMSLTGGGPGNVTSVLNTAVFRTFSMGNYGLSTALGVVVFLITALLSIIFMKLLMPKEDVN